MPYYVNAGIRPKDEKPMYGVYHKWIDGDFDKIALYDRTPDGGKLITEWNSGRPLKPDNMPTKTERHNGNNHPVPLLGVDSHSSCFFVNHKFKDILEELEPDTHQFFPIEVFEKGKKIADYFWLNVCNRLDTYHPELTYPRNARGFFKPVEGEAASRVFSKEAIGNHHAWIDKFAGAGGNGIFISNTFADRIKDAGLTGTSMHEFNEA
ncbi:imm11 family protein [Yoonia vestfoldensis]|uniref:imm11 family protein n=1 Tax=Yoonia vestfoldensis TaxID=245188 RepID=UPI001FDEFAD5|nr:DUF1629 domain-containing protein [Yoonia vestfoldensis]